MKIKTRQSVSAVLQVTGSVRREINSFCARRRKRYISMSLSLFSHAVNENLFQIITSRAAETNSTVTTQPHPRPGETPNKTSRTGQNCRQSIRVPQSRHIWACVCGLMLTGQWRRKVLPICFRAVSPSPVPLGTPLCVRFSINQTNLNHPQESEREISSYVLMQQSPILHHLQTHTHTNNVHGPSDEQ